MHANNVRHISGPMWNIQNELRWYCSKRVNGSSSTVLSVKFRVSSVVIISACICDVTVSPVDVCSLNASTTTRLISFFRPFFLIFH